MVFAKFRAAAHKAVVSVKDAPLRASIVAAGLLSPVLSHAQAVDPWDAAIQQVKDKISKYAGDLVLVSVVGVLFMIAVKYVKKIRGAA